MGAIRRRHPAGRSTSRRCRSSRRRRSRHTRRPAGTTAWSSTFTYTKTGPVCPELTSGNFGWIDYSGGSNSNADLKHEIAHPEDADITWYYRNCTGAADTNCRDPHDPADAADDHWLVEGTPGHRDTSLRLVCDLYLGKIIYVPIWDDFHLIAQEAERQQRGVPHHRLRRLPPRRRHRQQEQRRPVGRRLRQRAQTSAAGRTTRASSERTSTASSGRRSHPASRALTAPTPARTCRTTVWRSTWRTSQSADDASASAAGGPVPRSGEDRGTSSSASLP